MKGSRLPVLFEDRTMGLRILLVLVVPVVFGAIAGLALGASKALYLVLQLIAAVGGVLIAITHALVGGTENGLLPVPALLPVITAVAGGILASLGALLRRRLEAHP
jgi:hypothetical protein